jgi:hypothetical protein
VSTVEPLAAPNPATTNWVPLGSGSGVPQPVVNGQWVKGVGGAAVWSSIAAADIGGGYAPNKITVSTLAGGPPASPSDADIWIATGITAGGVRWAFQYNASSASAYKWEFIGGPPIYLSAVPGAVINTQTQVGATGYYYAVASAYTTVRAGDYIVDGLGRIAANGGTSSQIQGQSFAGAALVSDAGASSMLTTTDDVKQIPHVDRAYGVAASVVIGIGWTSNLPTTTQLVVQKNRFTPIRIS